VGAFSQGYGEWTAAQWRAYMTSRKLLITEHSAEQERGVFGAPDNEGTCLRMSGQFGDPSTCGSTVNSAACRWGAGSLAWLLASDNHAVSGVILWPTHHSGASGNQIGGRASQMTYENGSLTPVGRAFLAMPNNGLAVNCAP